MNINDKFSNIEFTNPITNNQNKKEKTDKNTKLSKDNYLKSNKTSLNDDNAPLNNNNLPINNNVRQLNPNEIAFLKTKHNNIFDSIFKKNQK